MWSDDHTIVVNRYRQRIAQYESLWQPNVCALGCASLEHAARCAHRPV